MSLSWVIRGGSVFLFRFKKVRVCKNISKNKNEFISLPFLRVMKVFQGESEVHLGMTFEGPG